MIAITTLADAGILSAPFIPRFWSDPGFRACSLAFLAAAIAVALLAKGGERAWARFTAFTVGVGIVTFGLISVIAGSGAPSSVATKLGWASPADGVGLILIGAAIGAASGRKLFLVGQALAVISGAMALTDLLSYTYVAGIEPSESLVEFDVALLAISAWTVSLRRERGIWFILKGDDLGGRAARVLLPVAIVFPLLLDVIAGNPSTAPTYDVFRQRAIHAGLVSAVSAIIVLLSASWLRQMELRQGRILQEMAATDERLRLQIERMPIGCIVWDPSLRVTAWNPAAEKIFGFSATEMLGQNPMGRIIPEGFAAEKETTWNRLLQGETNTSSVNENLTKDGRTIVCEWTNTPLHSDSGKVIGVLAMVKDVTVRVAAQRQLQESEDRFRDLIEHSHDLICTHDLDGTILSVNPAASKALGYPAEALVGMKLQDVLTPVALESYPKYIESIKTADRAAGLMEVVTHSGERRLWKYDNSLRRQDGAPLLVRGIAHDVTEQYVAEAALRKSEERYRTLFQDSPLPKIVFDDETDAVVAVNDAAVRQFGYERAELMSRHVGDLLNPEDISRIAQARRGGDPDRRYRDLPLRCKDGSVFFADVASKAVLFERRPSRLVIISDVTDRATAKREMQEARQFNEEVISGAGQGVVALDRELRILVWNRFMEEGTGRQAFDVLDRPATEVAPFRDNLAAEEALRNTLESGTRQSVEFEANLNNGRRWLQQVSVAHRDHAGQLVGVIAIISDITELMRAEESLRGSRELVRSVIDAIPNIVFSLDLDDRYTTANETLCKALGRSEQELIGHHYSEFGIAPDQPDQWKAIHDEVLTTGKRVEFRTTFTLPDGQRTVSEGSLSPLFDSRGTVTGISGTTLDVTDKLRMIESLARLSQAVEKSAEVIFMTDRQGKITYANAAFESVYGYSQAETLGHTPRILKSGLYSQSYYEDFWQTILGGKSVHDEMINKAKDGRLVTVDRSVSPIFGESGDLIGFLSVQSDISERKRMEAEREDLRAQMTQLAKMEAIGTLAGGVAHDFNNILSIILSFATVAERSRKDDQKFVQAQETIKQAVRRGSDLAKQILTFARRAETTPEAVDMNDLLKEILKLVETTFSRTIRFESSFASDLPIVIADPTQMHQALLNLFINARDAMPAGGTIRVSTNVIPAAEVRRRFPQARQVPYAGIQIRDTGTGMSEAVRQRIFEPFFTTKGEGRGTGLGLAVTYGAVTTAGGFIGVESEIGHGTAFEILLPLPETEGVQQREDSAGVMDVNGTETILFVEDEPDIGPLIVQSLEEHGYRALLARDGVEAERLFRTHRKEIDVIVSDDDLPLMAGHDLFLALKKQQNTAPFILTSGFLEPQVLNKLQQGGLKYFLQKPYEIHELLVAVRSALKSSRVGEVS